VNSPDDVVGHRGVDPLRRPYEVEGEPVGGGPVQQVCRVDGNAVPPDAGPRPEGLVAEGLGGRAPQHVPHVDADLVAVPGELVDERDVHVPVGVLKQLGQFGLTGAAGHDDAADESFVERGAPLGAQRGAASHDLRSGADVEGGVAGVDPFG
jgi:hypothetical protein